MKIYEIGTGYTSIPADFAAATEIVIEQLSKPMIGRGIDVEIIDKEDKNRKTTDLPINEVHIPRFARNNDTTLGLRHKIKRVLYSIAVAKKLKQILRESNEKVILHFHNQYNLFFSLSLTKKSERKNAIIAYTNHSGIWSLDWKKAALTLKTKYFQEAQCMRKADILFLLNEKTKDNVIRHLEINEDKIVMINNGVNTKVYTPLDSAEIQKEKERLGLDGKKVILQVGSICENKGQDRALNLLLPLMRKDKSLVYAYAGGVVDARYHKKIKAFAQNNGIQNRVIYLGMIEPGSELNKIYNIAEAVITPSIFESFSMVTIEAYSAGVPVFINKRTLIPCDDCAVRYTEDNFEKVINDNILKNPENQTALRKSSRETAVEKYSWDKISDDYIDSFKQITDKYGDIFDKVQTENNNKMKILLVNKFLYPHGGSETYIFKLGDYLKALGHEVQYFGMEHEGRCVGNNIGAYTTDMDFHDGNMLSKLAYPVKTIYSREARQKIRLVLDDFMPDAVHLNNINYQLTPSIILEIVKWRKETNHKCRIVFTAHDPNLVCPNHMLYNPNTQQVCEKCLGGHYMNCTKGKCIHSSTAKSIVGTAEAYFWKANGAYKYIDNIICCSEFIKKKIDTNPLLADKTVVMHNFIDKIEQKEAEKENYVLYFGRFSPEKGTSLLVKVCKELPDIPFVFAGSGPLEDEVNETANIKNVGFQTGEALENIVRKARFSIMPSLVYENCPFSVMESQAYLTPVIGANAGGIPELIKAGKTGELFERENSDDLKNKIVKLWNNKELTAEYSQNCKYLKKFEIEDYCSKIINIYKE